MKKQYVERILKIKLSIQNEDTKDNIEFDPDHQTIGIID